MELLKTFLFSKRKTSQRPPRLSGLLFSSLFTLSLSAQTQPDIFIRTFTTHDSILIRWVPDNLETWKLGNKYGYTIERFAQSDFPNGKATILSTSPILPLPKTDSTWNELKREDKCNVFVFENLFNVKTVTANTDKSKLEAQMEFGLVLKAADLSINTAQAEGLFFCDHTISQGQSYVYRISLANLPLGIVHTPGIVSTTGKSSSLNSPEQLRADFKNKKATLTFNAASTREQYAGYVIERSDDSLHFTRVNSTLLTFAQSQYEKEKTELVYQDSLPLNHKTYWYRVRGFSYFGMLGPPSESVKGKGREEWTTFPVIDTLYSPDNKSVKMKWRLNEAIDSSLLKSFLVFHAQQVDGVYELISKIPLGKNCFSFTDEHPSFANYYRIAAISTENDTGFSFSYFLPLQDNEPPPVPQKLTGTIDTNGIVHLTWEKVVANDLKGYRVFRSNSLQEEFYEVSDSILLENNFTDSITMHTLTRQIYYCVRSVDKLYNNSSNSIPYRLKRPDKIAPVPPVVKSILHTDTTIQLEWINSSSDDVMCVELFRTASSGEMTQLSSWTGKDTLQHYTDFQANVGTDYTYSLCVTDSSGNTSTTKFPSIHFQPRIYPALKNLNALPDFEKRTITLSWKSPNVSVDRYVIYKSKKGEPLRTWKTVGGNFSSIIDRELYPGNTYVYAVKAVMKNGAETKIVRTEIVF